MVDLKFTVKNDDLTLLEERIRKDRDRAVDEMTGASHTAPGVGSATAYYGLLTSLLRQIRDHKSKLEHLAKEAKARK